MAASRRLLIQVLPTQDSPPRFLRDSRIASTAILDLMVTFSPKVSLAGVSEGRCDRGLANFDMPEVCIARDLPSARDMF